MVRTADPAKQEEKRRQILEAAERCFARDGFRGASIADICAEAQMSPGHVYHYFENKEAIIGALTEAGLKYVAQRVEEMTTEGDLLQALLSEMKRKKSKSKRDKSLLIVEMTAEAGRNPAIAGILREHHRALRDVVAGYLRAGQERGQFDRSLDVEQAAALLLCVMDGVGMLPIKDPAYDMTEGVEMLGLLMGRFLTATD